MVPILDMVFQLITFFMLVVNFKASELDRELQLPILGSAEPIEESAEEVIVLNIRASGDLLVRGQSVRNIPSFFRSEANIMASVHGLKVGEPLPVIVVVRADKAVKVKSMMTIIEACKSNGFDKFDFVVVRSLER